MRTSQQLLLTTISMGTMPWTQPPDGGMIDSIMPCNFWRCSCSGQLYHSTVAQRNPNTLMLDEMYKIAMDTQRESRPKVKKVKKMITAVHLNEKATAMRTRRFLPSRKGSFPKVRIKRKIPTQQKPATGALPPAPNLDQGTTPTRTANIVSTANSRTTLKKIVLKESETRNHAKTVSHLLARVYITSNNDQ
jgi:hypothetical protein